MELYGSNYTSWYNDNCSDDSIATDIRTAHMPGCKLRFLDDFLLSRLSSIDLMSFMVPEFYALFRIEMLFELTPS